MGSAEIAVEAILIYLIGVHASLRFEMNVMGGGKSPFCRTDGSFASGNHPFAWGGPSFI